MSDEVDEPDMGDDPNWARLRVKFNREKARVAELEAQNEAQAAELAELGEMRAEVVFLRAGVDTTRPAGRAFFNHYDGDLSEDAVGRGYVEYLADANKASAAFTSRLIERGVSDWTQEGHDA